MDMDLVPVYEGDGGGEAGVSIRPEAINNLGVRTALAEKRAIERSLKVPGYVLRTDAGGLSVVADVFDRDADWVRPGITGMVQADAVPGRQWQGRVTRVEADIDVGARSWRVTLRVTASDGLLKPNMSADVTLQGRVAGAPVLAIPRDSVIRTGERSVVVRALEGGRFEPVAVDTGREFGDWIEINRGLAENERVVVSGQFLIDSEANLRAGLGRLGEEEQGGPQQ
jgi:Cu(I)/Ag(I) efflux system membrane fusion protein